MLDHEGKEVPGNRGYKYFGAAKDLPGVRELFETERKFSHIITDPDLLNELLVSVRTVCDLYVVAERIIMSLMTFCRITENFCVF